MKKDHLVAGALSASGTTVLLQPFDVYKTRVQEVTARSTGYVYSVLHCAVSVTLILCDVYDTFVFLLCFCYRTDSHVYSHG